MMETDSPISTVSSLQSYHTAAASNVDGSTAASSPSYHAPSPYRAARQLPRELKEHCQIYLEEQLCTCLSCVSGLSSSFFSLLSSVCSVRVSGIMTRC